MRYDRSAINTGLQQTITEKGGTLVCFSPVKLNAGGAGYYSDIILTWRRRNRITWQWMESIDVPMSEATEAYLVSIFSAQRCAHDQCERYRNSDGDLHACAARIAILAEAG